jgi:hypothetical protein
LLKQQLGDIALSDKTLNTVCKKLFNSKFLGVFMQNSNIPSKDGYIIINNDFIGGPGIHWLSGILVGKNMYIYDSFGRLGKNILPKLVARMQSKGYTIYNADTSDQDQYGNTSVDCGHRSISSLMIAQKYGIKAFMTL